jgi:hypothetical protein
MFDYANEWSALNDVLRLSRGMTFKAAITGLNIGGGKAVIMGDAKTQKTPEVMRKFGEFVHSLSGRYITAEDVGMETKDMDIVRDVTHTLLVFLKKEVVQATHRLPLMAFTWMKQLQNINLVLIHLQENSISARYRSRW